jgi:hypothetical protein
VPFQAQKQKTAVLRKKQRFLAEIWGVEIIVQTALGPDMRHLRAVA